METTKSTGIIRRVDDLGRLVIPREIRRNLGIHEGDPVELFTDEKGVYFKKYTPAESTAKKIRRLSLEIGEAADVSPAASHRVIEALRELERAIKDDPTHSAMHPGE